VIRRAMYRSAGGVYGPCEEEYSRGDRSCLSCLILPTTRFIGIAAPVGQYKDLYPHLTTIKSHHHFIIARELDKINIYCP
jgi:hypothetical protein